MYLPPYFCLRGILGLRGWLGNHLGLCHSHFPHLILLYCSWRLQHKPRLSHMHENNYSTNRTLEMMYHALINAGKHVTSNIPCAWSQRYTKDSVFWCHAFLQYVISRLFSDPMSFQMVKKNTVTSHLPPPLPLHQLRQLSCMVLALVCAMGKDYISVSLNSKKMCAHVNWLSWYNRY